MASSAAQRPPSNLRQPAARTTVPRAPPNTPVVGPSSSSRYARSVGSTGREGPRGSEGKSLVVGDQGPSRSRLDVSSASFRTNLIAPPNSPRTPAVQPPRPQQAPPRRSIPTPATPSRVPKPPGVVEAGRRPQTVHRRASVKKRTSIKKTAEVGGVGRAGGLAGSTPHGTTYRKTSLQDGGRVAAAGSGVRGGGPNVDRIPPPPAPPRRGSCIPLPSFSLPPPSPTSHVPRLPRQTRLPSAPEPSRRSSSIPSLSPSSLQTLPSCESSRTSSRDGSESESRRLFRELEGRLAVDDPALFSADWSFDQGSQRVEPHEEQENDQGFLGIQGIDRGLIRPFSPASFPSSIPSVALHPTFSSSSTSSASSAELFSLPRRSSSPPTLAGASWAQGNPSACGVRDRERVAVSALPFTTTLRRQARNEAAAGASLGSERPLQALDVGTPTPSLLSPRPIPLPAFSPLLEQEFEQLQRTVLSPALPPPMPPPLVRLDSHLVKTLAALDSVDSPLLPTHHSQFASPSTFPPSLFYATPLLHGTSPFGASPDMSLFEEGKTEVTGWEAERREMRESIWRRSFCDAEPWSEDSAWEDEDGSGPSSAEGSTQGAGVGAGEEAIVDLVPQEEEGELVIVNLDLLHQHAALSPLVIPSSPSLKDGKPETKLISVGLGLDSSTTALLPSLAYTLGARVRASAPSSFINRLSTSVSPSSSSYDGSSAGSSGSNASSATSSRCASSVADSVSSGEDEYVRNLVSVASAPSMLKSPAYSAASSPRIPSASLSPVVVAAGSPAMKAAVVTSLSGGGGGEGRRRSSGAGTLNRAWRVTASEGEDVTVWQ